jgi:hypothetical protein
MQENMGCIVFNNYSYYNIEEKGKNEQDPNMAMHYDTEQGIGSPVWIRVAPKPNTVMIYICTTR